MGDEKKESDNEDLDFQDILHNGGSALQMHYNSKLEALIKQRNSEHMTWGFKYPGLHQYHGALNKFCPNAKFIYVLRDPVCVAKSEVKRPDGVKDYEGVLRRTIQFNDRMVQLSTRNTNVHLVSYERLLTRTWAEVEDLLQFIDVNYNAAKIVELCKMVKLPDDRYRSRHTENIERFVS